MRRTSLDTVYELAKKDERIFFIGSDLGVGTLKQFKAEMPDRFLMEGVSEANILGMAAGLALEGKIVYVNSIAVFLTRRCFEQVALDLCLHNVNVRLIGNGGGLVYAPLGPTHEAIEDLAIMRALPRMTVLAPADAREMREAITATVEHLGPVYVRLGKGGEPILTEDCGPFAIGAAYAMREGRDALILSTGVMLKAALEGADRLAALGIAAAVLHVPTIKPLDGARILEHAKAVRAVVTLEEHSVVGGLGSAVAELLAEAAFMTPTRLKRLGIPDIFPDRYGSQASLMERFGLTAERVQETVVALLEARPGCATPRTSGKGGCSWDGYWRS